MKESENDNVAHMHMEKQTIGEVPEARPAHVTADGGELPGIVGQSRFEAFIFVQKARTDAR